jgi:hypothetical protein
MALMNTSPSASDARGAPADARDVGPEDGVGRASRVVGVDDARDGLLRLARGVRRQGQAAADGGAADPLGPAEDPHPRDRSVGRGVLQDAEHHLTGAREHDGVGDGGRVLHREMKGGREVGAREKVLVDGGGRVGVNAHLDEAPPVLDGDQAPGHAAGAAAARAGHGLVVDRVHPPTDVRAGEGVDAGRVNHRGRAAGRGDGLGARAARGVVHGLFGHAEAHRVVGRLVGDVPAGEQEHHRATPDLDAGGDGHGAEVGREGVGVPHARRAGGGLGGHRVVSCCASAARYSSSVTPA